MKFYEYHDLLTIMRGLVPWITRERLYYTAKLMSNSDPLLMSSVQCQWEETWISERRPFYRVWPKILPMLLKLSLKDVPTSAIRLPPGISSLLIQLPVTNEVANTIIVMHLDTTEGPGTLIGGFDGELTDGLPNYDMWIIPSNDTPIIDAINGLITVGTPASIKSRDSILSLVATLCLLEDNPELITPVLLSADVGKTDVKRLAEKARKRGRIGWDIGASIEVAPHFRRPHPALVWTGQGRTTPKIILRSGSVVHRNKVADIPEGYLG